MCSFFCHHISCSLAYKVRIFGRNKKCLFLEGHKEGNFRKEKGHLNETMWNSTFGFTWGKLLKPWDKFWPNLNQTNIKLPWWLGFHWNNTLEHRNPSNFACDLIYVYQVETKSQYPSHKCYPLQTWLSRGMVQHLWCETSTMDPPRESCEKIQRISCKIKTCASKNVLYSPANYAWHVV
jgi:hypothetical protein